ncbi:MAG: HsdR family type I site-specific deoxyribonuclease [Rickettsiales bacterium]|jgi:type I restriction enzyme R subunit|nr:HsdR family type I site-specific deoxyribonuclease [Rickettsiales bacterium]
MIDDIYTLPDFDEASFSQIPALIQLINLGYIYIPRNNVNKFRNGLEQYILSSIAIEAISKINPGISQKSIEDALIELEKVRMDDGVYKASEYIYTDILAGRAASEIVDGKKVSPQMRFIDFTNPKNNIYHVAAEFEIAGEQDRRPDIVLFVNGIPMVVIECKKGSVNVKEAITQMLRNQQGNNIPKFFLFPQILIATNGIELKYATMLTPSDYYSVWKEEADALPSLNGAIPDETLKQISADLTKGRYIHRPTSESNEQAKGIYNLLRPERLLDIVKNFILYDDGIKKITRYQQYFAIKKTLERLEETPRRGGLIWHTQGSGKSLTMVMLVKELIERYANPRIIIVTDRRDLDKQISDTFAACNIKKNVYRATSAANLIKKVIEDKSLDIITSLIQKFDRIQEHSKKDEDNNIFILIDEAHRTQMGEANAWMNAMLPNACVIAFTGTPLMKSEKSSAAKFGGIIDAYTISEAEADGAILPLIYQSMFVDMRVCVNLLDEFYKRITKRMTEEQRKDFEKKAALSQMMDQNSSRIEMIALNIVDHYKEHFQGTGLKGQIVMPSKYSAIICKKAIDLLGGARAEVIISESAFEDGTDDLPEQKQLIVKFFEEEKRRFGSLDNREKTIIEQFKDKNAKFAEGPELLIVVDKLLTGFDAPRNTVLYLAKQLKEHNLLQAIARVNRLFGGDKGKPEKESGIIIDYSKNAQNLKSAMELFSNYDAKDVDGALISTPEKIAELDALYQNLCDSLKGKSSDECLNYLKSDELKRNKFYEEVNRFIKAFSTCLSLYDFYQFFPADKLKQYSLDLKRFVELKKTTHLSMAEKIDFSKYRVQIHKILDKYVAADTVEELSKTINLSNVREFNQFIEDQKNGMSARSRAEAIAAQTKKVIYERYEQDVAFYGKFSERIEKLLEEIRDAKKEDIASLLNIIKETQKQVDNYEDADIPNVIRSQKTYHPFYRNLKQFIKADDEKISIIIKDITDIIEHEKRVDWENNITTRRTVMNNIDDYLYDIVKDKMKIDLSGEQIDAITDKAWSIAINNKEN